MSVIKCTKCGNIKPATREFFGSTPVGNLRHTCRICVNKKSAEYEQKNKDKRQLRDQKRASKDVSARSSFDEFTKRDLLKRQNSICPCCFEKITILSDAEVDHATPISRGGKHDRSNFILAHAKCNREKHNKTLFEHWDWRVRVGLDTVNLGKKFGII